MVEGNKECCGIAGHRLFWEFTEVLGKTYFLRVLTDEQIVRIVERILGIEPRSMGQEVVSRERMIS